MHTEEQATRPAEHARGRRRKGDKADPNGDIDFDAHCRMKVVRSWRLVGQHRKWFGHDRNGWLVMIVMDDWS